MLIAAISRQLLVAIEVQTGFFLVRREYKNGYLIECAFDYDHPRERKLVHDGLESHRAFCSGNKERYAKEHGIMLSELVKPAKKRKNPSTLHLI